MATCTSERLHTGEPATDLGVAATAVEANPAAAALVQPHGVQPIAVAIVLAGQLGKLRLPNHACACKRLPVRTAGPRTALVAGQPGLGAKDAPAGKARDGSDVGVL